MEKNLKYDKGAAIITAESLGGTDRVMMRTPDGIRAVPPSLLASVPEITAWDAKASEASVGFHLIPFTRMTDFPEAGGPIASQYNSRYGQTPATVNDTTKTVTKPYIDPGKGNTGLFSIQGRIPDSGKYWFSFSSPDADDSSNRYVWLEIGAQTNARQSDRATRGAYIEIYESWVYTEMLGPDWAEYDQDPIVGNLAALVCLDVDAGTIKTYTEDGLLSTYTPAGGIAGMHISGGVFSPDTGSITAIFNTTSGASPFAVPGGHTALNMLNAVLPSAAGKMLVSSTRSFLDDMVIDAEHLYYVVAQGKIVPFMNERNVAVLNRKNSFSADQTFLGQIQIGGSYKLKMLQSNICFTYNSTAVETALNNTSATGNNTLWAGSVSLLTGTYNVWMGNAFVDVTEANSSVGLGFAAQGMKFANCTTALGAGAGGTLQAASFSTFVGAGAGSNIGYHLYYTVAIGDGAMASHTNDTIVGGGSASTVFSYNIAIGSSAMVGGNFANENIAIGRLSFVGVSNNPAGDSNIAIGTYAMNGMSAGGAYNVGIGRHAMHGWAGGDNNTAIGREAMVVNTGTKGNCTALGYRAMYQHAGAITNSTALGANAAVTGDNQVQLGDSATTTYVYGTVQSRSDQRDKADVRDTILGLDFIRKLRPVDYRWDLRDDYIDRRNCPVEPLPLGPAPQKPITAPDSELSPSQLAAYDIELQKWNQEKLDRDEAMVRYTAAYEDWYSRNNMNVMRTNGVYKRSRFHHGFLAQEVKGVADEMATDFGGYQDHSQNGGLDVRSLGYEEFIAPMVKAIQELDQRALSEEYIDIIVDKVVAKLRNVG